MNQILIMIVLRGAYIEIMNMHVRGTQERQYKLGYGHNKNSDVYIFEKANEVLQSLTRSHSV